MGNMYTKPDDLKSCQVLFYHPLTMCNEYIRFDYPSLTSSLQLMDEQTKKNTAPYHNITSNPMVLALLVTHIFYLFCVHKIVSLTLKAIVFFL